MAAPADGSPQLARPNAAARRTIVVRDGEVTALPVVAAGLSVAVLVDGVLIAAADGSEFLLQADPGTDPTGLGVALADGTITSVADLLAAEVADVAPAAGNEPAAAGSNGRFSSLVLDTLVGIRDLGPLGFSDPVRGASESEFRRSGADPDVGASAGAPGSAPPLSHVPSINPAIVPADTFEDAPSAAAPVAVPVSLVPGAPGETATVVVSGIPAGMTFNAPGDATGLPAGSLRFTQAEAAALAITGVPADSDGDIHIAFTPFSQAPGAAPVAGATQNWTLTIDAVADATIVTTSPASGGENAAIAIAIGVALSDTDGSESVGGVTISGVPAGAALSAGVETAPGSGVFVLSASDLPGLTLTPPAGFNGALTLGVVATSLETPLDGELTVANNVAPTTTSLIVTVTPASGVPSIPPIVPADTLEDAPSATSPVAVPVMIVAGGPGEVATVVVSGIPAGMSFNAAGDATGLPPGSLRFTRAEAASLAVTGIAADADSDVTLVFTPFSQDGAAAPVAGAPQPWTLTVDAVADAPTLSTAPASGAEGDAIALQIAAAVADADGSESLGAFHIAGVPAGALLNAGIDLGGGVWQVQPVDVPGLTFAPPANFNGTVSLVVTATSVENPSDGEANFANNAASVSAPLVVTVAPVSDAPTVSVAPVASGFEDLVGGTIAIPVTVAPGAPGETAYVVVSGIPAGVAFNAAGIAAGAGALRFTQAEAAALRVTALPANADGDFALTVAPFSQDGAAPPASGAARTIAITVDAVADAPLLAVAPAAGAEDGAIALSIAPALLDSDGSEALAIRVSGVPAGATLNHGSFAGGVWTLAPADLVGLTLTPPTNFNGNLTLGVTAITTETPGDVELTTANNAAATSASLVVSVAPVSDTPTMTLGKVAISLKEDLGSGDVALAPPAKGVVSVPISVAPGAPGETAYVIVSGVPSGMKFNSAGTTTGLPAGSIRFTQAQAAALIVTQLPSHSDGDFALTVTPFSQDGAAAPAAGAAQTIAVTVDAVADRPNLAGANTTGGEDTAITFNLANALVDKDGSEILSGATLGNIPTGSVLTRVEAGVTTTLAPSASVGGKDSYVLDATQIAGLRIQTPKDFNGKVSITATLTAHENASVAPAELNTADNDAARAGTITLTVTPVSDTPGLTLGVTSAQAKEDLGAGPIALAPPAKGAIDMPLTVTPGAPGETAYVVLTGFPAGTTFSHGGLVGSQYRVSQADALNLKLTGLPANSDGDVRVTVTPFSQDVGGVSAKAGEKATITLTVDAVADVPTLAPAVTGAEDTLIALNLSAALRDTDGSERLSGQLRIDSSFKLLSVSGSTTTTLAPSSTSGGVSTYDVTETQLPRLHVRPPANFHGDTTIAASLTARETATGATEPNAADNTAATSGTFVLTVTPVSDTPALTVPSIVAVKEDLGAASSGAGAPGTTGGFAAVPPAAGIAAMALLVSPGAPGETAYVQVSGVPAGVAFNVPGVAIAPGILRFTQAEAAALTVTAVPADLDADIALTVTPFSQDSGGVAAASGPARVVTLRLDAVADVPTLTAPAAIATVEDAVVSGATQRIALSLSAALADVDGSESLTLRVAGVPAGLALSAGSFDSASGSWIVPGASLAGLALIAPQHWSGAFTLGVTAVASETATGAGEPNATDNVATRFATLPVTVAAVADAPPLSVAAAKGDEDSFITLNVASSLVDQDGSEALAMRLTGVPAGSTLVGGGATLAPISSLGGLETYALTGAQLAGLKIRPPHDSNVDFTLGVTAVATEASNGDVAGSTAAIAVDVVGVADAGIMISAGGTPEGAADAAGGRVPLNVVVGTSDADGSESVTAILISGVPLGMSLSRGLITAVGPSGTTWSLTRTGPGSAEWDDVELVGWQSHLATTLTLGASAVVTSEDDGDFNQTAFAGFPVAVTPVVDDYAPSASAAGTEDTPIAIAIAAGLVDADGSERLTGDVTLSGVPSGVVIRSGGSVVAESGPGVYVVSQAQLAGLTATPPANSNVDFTLGATITVAEFDSANAPIAGQTRTESFTFAVDVRGDADVPTATAAPASGQAGTSFDLALGGGLADADGSERLYFIVEGVPAGAGLRLGAAGAGKLLFNLDDGRWLANQAAIGDLELRTRSDFADAGARSMTLALTAVAEENDGDRTSSAPSSFVVTITPEAGGGGGGGGGSDGGNPGGPGAAPTIVVNAITTADEDTPAGLSLGLGAIPADAAADLIIRAASLPPNSRVVSAVTGAIFVDPFTGDWIIANDPAVLTSLQIHAPADFAGTLHPVVDAVVTYADGSVGTAQAVPALGVAPVADQAAIAASGAGAEDTLIKLSLAAVATDADGSESVTQLRISGVGAGAVLVDSLGNPLAQSGGVYAIVDANDVYVRPAVHFSGAIALTVSAVTADSAAGFALATTTTSTVVSVAVAAAADADLITGPAVLAGAEGAGVALGAPGNVTVTPIDVDGSEVTSVVVAVLAAPPGLAPKEIAFSKGINNGDGSWTMTPAEFAAVQMSLPPFAAGDVAIRVTANAFELANGATASAARDFTVRFEAVADAPTLSVAPAAGNEDAPVPLSILAGLVDADGSETLSLSIEGMPSGATLSAGIDNGDGTWSLTPGELAGLVFTGPQDGFGAIDLTVVATATEAGGGKPASAATTQTLQIVLADVVDGFAGGAGADSLVGTAGADLLEGKGGADMLTGGAGADRFVYGPDALGAADLIVDWDAGDRLDVSQLLSGLAAAIGDAAPAGGDYVRLAQNGADVEMRVDQNGAQPGDTSTLLAVVANATAADVQSRTDFS